MQLRILLFLAHSPPKSHPFQKSNPLEIILSETKTIQQKTLIFIYYFLQLSYLLNPGSFFTLKTDFLVQVQSKTPQGEGRHVNSPQPGARGGYPALGNLTREAILVTHR